MTATSVRPGTRPDRGARRPRRADTNLHPRFLALTGAGMFAVTAAAVLAVAAFALDGRASTSPAAVAAPLFGAARPVAFAPAQPATPTATVALTPAQQATPTATAVVTDTEVLVLRQALGRFIGQPSSPFCPPDIEVAGAVYSYRCPVAAGHFFYTAIQRFDSPEAARAAFDGDRAGRPETPFHGYASFSWERSERPDDPGMPMRTRYHGWVAARWVFTTTSFDDTIYEIAPRPISVAEDVFVAMVDHRLLPDDGTITRTPTPEVTPTFTATAEMPTAPPGPTVFVTATPVPEWDGVEAKALRRLAGVWLIPPQMCAPDLPAPAGGEARATCTVAAGHAVTAWIRTFDDAASAAAAFDAERAGAAVTRFHGYQAAAWQEDERPADPALPMRHRYHL